MGVADGVRPPARAGCPARLELNCLLAVGTSNQGGCCWIWMARLGLASAPAATCELCRSAECGDRTAGGPSLQLPFALALYGGCATRHLLALSKPATYPFARTGAPKVGTGNPCVCYQTHQYIILRLVDCRLAAAAAADRLVCDGTVRGIV